MKKIIIPLITFLIGAASVYFLFPQKKECPVAETTSVTTTESSKVAPSSSWPTSFVDSIPAIVKMIKANFASLSDTATSLPVLNATQQLYLASYYSAFLAAPRPPKDLTAARAEIQAYRDAANADVVTSVWVPIADVTDLLGINGRIGNPNGYDGFRFYFAKALDPDDAADINKTTLVAVATKKVGATDRTDILTVSGFTGIFNKFDPCPPPTPCAGTLLFPH